jgi:hypothetical protein
MTSSLLTAEPTDALALHRPKLILPIGSGGAGKSFWSRWFIERAAKRGAPLDICDADPLSPVLARSHTTLMGLLTTLPATGSIIRTGSKGKLRPQPSRGAP